MVTIHEVAKAAGVSISTVSYALSGKRAISATTRARIDQAVAELDYRPNAGARMLAGARTNILALSAPIREDAHLPTHMRFVTAVVEAARAHDDDVLLLARDDEVTGIRRVVDSSLVDGVVVLGVSTDDERAEVVRRSGAAASFVGVPGDTTGLTCIDLDFAEAGRASVRQLAAAGHRSIGVIGHPATYVERHTGFIRRFADAFEDECRAASVATLALYPSLDRADQRRAADELLAGLPDMTALVFHCNEPVVEAVLAHLVSRGVRVPEDVSVLAACASYDTDVLEVPLSTIPLPLEEMCRGAVEGAVRQVDGAREPGVTLLRPRFIDRGSIRPVH
ncbi:LacI family transcriptional regulator [Curtobacterium sp. MCJR17_055]|uniref:LacI family DNA-binding transcriptional regulator n=1 Tax=unclassified Curtobacterium TaxID=257496 RepID=UPI000D9A4002|nr:MULTISPECIES: LacI family DNA-binding transcriptional regulator [unclassified Curtobacterium]PYY32410.1 LacI family transcriptional regulator [Curtobacterium sp. MCBD17_029]PYY57144.1 LacI family transcriptional regulator [Curtobacterium sp. MCJR17_055]PYY61940.1 LacI family transcriptional regulator [Curtobacterium sp. MCPF17_015]